MQGTWILAEHDDAGYGYCSFDLDLTLLIPVLSLGSRGLVRTSNPGLRPQIGLEDMGPAPAQVSDDVCSCIFASAVGLGNILMCLGLTAVTVGPPLYSG